MSMNATITMLRARREEHVAMVGVVGALFSDDIGEALRRIPHVVEAAKECERACGRSDRLKRRICREVASQAEELEVPLRQLLALESGTP